MSHGPEFTGQMECQQDTKMLRDYSHCPLQYNCMKMTHFGPGELGESSKTIKTLTVKSQVAGEH